MKLVVVLTSVEINCEGHRNVAGGRKYWKDVDKRKSQKGVDRKKSEERYEEVVVRTSLGRNFGRLSL